MKKPRGLDHKDPAKMAEFIDKITEPFSRVQAVAESCGLSRDTAKDLSDKMNTRFQPVKEELRQVKVSELLGLIEDRLHRSLEHLDDTKMQAASAKDLAIAIGILVEKRQLLRGEPTQILSLEERQNLNDMLPAIIVEARRRGVTIDVDPVTQETRLIGETNYERRRGKGTPPGPRAVPKVRT